MNCGKCQGSFEKEGKDPLLLPSCGHTLCRSCLRLFTQHNGFKCPFCGVKQPPKVSLSDLRPNYALLNFIESMNDDGRGGKKGDRHRPLNREDHQERDRDRSTHISKESECVEHEGVRLTYWCGPCGVAACGECVYEKHNGNSGGRKHVAVRIDSAIQTRRSELEQLVCKVTQTMDTVEEKHTSFAKSSSFIKGRKRLQTEATAVVGKMKIVMSMLACLVQEGEEGDEGMQQLRQEIEKLIQKTPQSGSAIGKVTEMKALMQHLKCIEDFRDGPVAKVLKETDNLGKEERQIFLSSALIHTAVLNMKAVALFKQVVLCGGGGCYIEVVGGGGLMGSITWHQDKLHLHCLRRLSPSNPRRPTSDPARRNALKWEVLQAQMQEVTQVFLELAWGGSGQGGTGKECVYFKLYRPDSHNSTLTSYSRFLHLVMGDKSGDGNNSLLGPLVWDVQEVAGARVILLGTHIQGEGEGVEDKMKSGVAEETKSKTDTHTHTTSSNASAPITFAAGDVICVKGRQSERAAEYWLVTEGNTLITKPQSVCEVVGSLLPAHTSLLTKLPSLKGVRVEDCGGVLSNEKEATRAPSAAPSARVSPSVGTLPAAPSLRVSPSVHAKNSNEGYRKPRRGAVSYDALDEIA